MNQLKAIANRIMRERGLVPDFPAAALRETSAMVERPVVPSPPLRDLRDLLWVSIDNDTSRDLDQLSVASKVPGGAVKILVAIADVDALVKRHTAIDDHAEKNTTSVYTAAGVFSMLPERLSTDLTSLGEGQDRLALVMEMLVEEGGAIKQSDVYRAAVRNRAKLAYNGLAAWLDGSAKAPAPLAAVSGLDEQIRIQDRVAQKMRGLRFQHGALSLQTPQAEAVFDGEAVTDLRPAEHNRAKELIEDFMVAANGVTARYLARKGFPPLRRVLRSPKAWNRIVALAQGVGAHLPAEPNGEALAGFLDQRRLHDPARFPDLSLSVVKLLGRGEYALELPDETTEGHFGLAATDYTHSTAPNRRFPDLVTQRLLKAAIAGEAAPYRNEELSALATHCTEQETNAQKVERHVNKSAAAMLLASRIGEVFESAVTGASEKGTWVRISHPATEGRLVRGFKGLEVGDRLRVKLVHTDVERGFIDFARVG
ncbi:MAG: RNB domain-containing ribonuclease [Vicinamibacteria bacterium]|nr:RNB domain-containing ribonuclease [Vicinamibacteria bacterium]